MTSNYLSLRKKLVIGVFLISTVVTTVSVLITFINDYRVEISQLNDTILSIESSNVKPISKLVWDFNYSQIQTQLESLGKLPEVYSIKVTFEDKKSIFYAKTSDVITNLIIKRYDLNFEVDGENKKIGELEIQYDKQNVLNKVYSKLVVLIILQSIKSFVISFLLLVFFQKVVTGRLEALSQYLEEMNDSQFHEIKKVHFKKVPFLFNTRDEVTELRRIIKKMSFKVHKYNSTMNKRVQEAETFAETERAKAIYASKMASLGEMAAGIAHEVNNPLAIIDGRVTLMQRYSTELVDPTRSKYLIDISKVKKMTQRISKIIKGLRYFAREGSHDPLEITNFQSILTDTNALIVERLNSTGLQYTFTDLDFKIQCRPVEISQVLLNLINNAVDATADLPERWIKLEAELIDDHRVCIRVIDSGPGISNEIEDKIMQPFFTTKEVGKGTGLGLSISSGIIGNLGGTLKVNRNYKNTCFEITLNLATE